MNSKKKEQTPMEKLTQGYDKFIKGREIKEDGKDQFEKALKKAANTKKQRGAK
jgi:hypothetical protein